MLKKYLIKRYIGHPKILKEVEKDTMGYVSGIVYGKDFYDRTVKLILSLHYYLRDT